MGFITGILSVIVYGVLPLIFVWGLIGIISGVVTLEELIEVFTGKKDGE